MENKTEKVFADGMIFKKPRENAPDFVKGSVSVKVEEFTKFIAQHNNNGWVNLDLKLSKGGKLYLELNTWKSEGNTETTNAPKVESVNIDEDINSSEDIPFN